MKTTAGELWKIRGALTTLLGMRFEPAVSFRMRTFTRTVKEAIEGIEEKRQELVRELGSQTPAGVQIQEPAKLEQFNAAWKGLMEEEVELPDVRITIEELTAAKLVLTGAGGVPIETTMTAEELADTGKVVTYDGSTK